MARTPLLALHTPMPTFYSWSPYQITEFGPIVHDTKYTDKSNDRGAPSHTRPKTPPRPSAANAQHPASHLAHRSGNTVASPPREKPYSGIMSEDDEEDDDDEIVYDDDEDEFGLPSLASMRRKRATPLKPKSIDPGGSFSSLGYGLAANNRQRANSSDIAEERGTPMYPTARKSEGKILRPQYKDILQGRNTIRDPRPQRC